MLFEIIIIKISVSNAGCLIIYEKIPFIILFRTFLHIKNL